MRFARIFRVQREEGRLVALVVGLMFVASAALTIGESGVDALFFNRVGAQALPVMYLLQGAAAFLAMLVLTGVLGRLGPRRAYLSGPLVLAAAVLGGRCGRQRDSDLRMRVISSETSGKAVRGAHAAITRRGLPRLAWFCETPVARMSHSTSMPRSTVSTWAPRHSC